VLGKGVDDENIIEKLSENGSIIDEEDASGAVIDDSLDDKTVENSNGDLNINDEVADDMPMKATSASKNSTRKCAMKKLRQPISAPKIKTCFPLWSA
jgi:hypothetical protein